MATLTPPKQLGTSLGTTKSDLIIAPGARILVRTEEWLVRNVEPSKDGGHLIYCEGITDLVRGVEAEFLTVLENDIEILDPALTKLVADESPKFNAAFLYIESLRFRSTPNDAQIHLAHKSVMKENQYQFDPAKIALKQPRTRILIADAVGLGKTLEAGILATELLQRGRGKRILVITLKSMLTQFQKEWWSRFSIPLVRLDSIGLARVRDRIPANHNPFNYYDKTIISMDTLKNNLEYRNYLEKAFWDIIVIDECQNVAMRQSDQSSSRRARLAQLLSGRSDTLILLSATPHDGSSKSFASLIHLLDRTVIPDPDNYTPEDFRDKGLVVRRFKKDIRNEVGSDFQERITNRLDTSSTVEEERAYTKLLSIPFTQKGTRLHGRSYELQRVGMQKALFSSPAAAIQSTVSRIVLLESSKAEAQYSADVSAEIDALHEFHSSLTSIDKLLFSKYQLLLQTLRSGQFVWSGQETSDRIVLFSERIETLNWLNNELAADLGLKPNQIDILHGGMTDTEQQEMVDRFGRASDPLRIMLCSDVASEGLNLHYFCHRIIHFDMPWSLMTYLQRNGRVDRFGQKERPIIIYLQTKSRNPKVRGDQRILEILQAKDEQANKNLGDPLSFLDVYDEEKEVEKVEGFMATGLTAEQVEQKLDQTRESSTSSQLDQFNAFMASLTQANDEPLQPKPHFTATSLFTDHYLYAKSALELLQQRGRFIQWACNDNSRTVTLTAPPELKSRLRQIPQEAHRVPYVLSANPGDIANAMEAARQAKAEEDTWPKIEYLWQQHPISEWLADSVVSLFSGHKAPVIRSSKLKPDESAIILAGTVPNRKGRPVIVEWQVATRIANHSFNLEPFDQFALRAGLKAGTLPSAGWAVPPILQDHLPEAVNVMRNHMAEAQREFDRAVQPKLQQMLADLNSLRQRKIELLERQFAVSGQIETVKSGILRQKAGAVQRDFDDYQSWIHESLETEPQAFIQVIAAVHNITEAN